jgi:hypothetical protein
MAAIARVSPRVTPEHRSEAETIATLALFFFGGLIVSLLVLSPGVELSAEFF